MGGWNYEKIRTEKDYIYWLRHNNVSKERKWIYTLIAWCMEHRHEKVMKINQHINTIWHHNRGYFDKYKTEKTEQKTKEYFEKYYDTHEKTIKKQSLDHNQKVAKVWRLYKSGKLPEMCTKRIDAELAIYEMKLNIRGKCK